MPKQDKKFVNPLLQATEKAAESPSTPTFTSTSTPVEQEEEEAPTTTRKRGNQAFEKTHERLTIWVEKRLKQQFEALAEKEEKAKTTLMNEALADLLKKRAR